MQPIAQTSGDSIPRKLLLQCNLSPGDVVVLSAAVRDLHLAHPGKFLTDVRTACPAIWENNPYVTPLHESDPDVQVVECKYPLIHQSNQVPLHFIHGYRMHLAETLNIPIPPTAFRGDIHLAPVERSWMSQVEEVLGLGSNFWIIVAGGKRDFTIKWWHPERWQGVVDTLEGEIQFVQIGSIEHEHPPLKGVIDFRGKTDLRQLIRLVHHASGVLSPVTLAMHLAAAVPVRTGRRPLRPCVVVAGSREPAHWEAYPGHRFLENIGSLDCCGGGACWKSRTSPLGDGEEHDEEHRLCTDVAGDLPRCMDMISVEDVVQAIRSYTTNDQVQSCLEHSLTTEP